MLILNIPIEPIEERYSSQWDRWFNSFFAAQTVSEVQTIYGEKTSGKINQGSFLDIIETNQYKNSQLKTILHILSRYDDSYRLVLFFHDLWFPGLESIAYIRDGMRFKNLKICGCLHAGSYDPYDFLNKIGMANWASNIEHSWFSCIADKIFVATEFHKKLLHNSRNVSENKIYCTGFPIYAEFAEAKRKEKIVVFPHRLDVEKNPDVFDRLTSELSFRFPDWEFIKTKEMAKNKKQYYDILNKSSIAVSFADQETWGIAMQEALFCDCTPICPNKLSYSEMYDSDFLFSTYEEAKMKVVSFIQSNKSPKLRPNKITLLKRGSQAIFKIFKELCNV